jgi:hypothetical protein
MTSQLARPSALLIELKKLIDLPEGLIALDLHLRVDCVPTITCTFHANMRDAEPLKKMFLLSEIIDIKE